MVQTLTFGLKKPETGDKGTPVFEALEDNIDLLDTHDHDGQNSKRMNSYNVSRGTVSVSDSEWSSSGNLYRKTVTLPTGFSTANGSDFGKASIRFFLSGGTYDGNECLPKIERINATSFYLYSPVNDQAFTVVFT